MGKTSAGLSGALCAMALACGCGSEGAAGLPADLPAPAMPVAAASPRVDSALFDPDTRQITVTATGVDAGSALTVSLAPPAGIWVDQPSRAVSAAAGPQPAVFNVNAQDQLQGASGTVAVTVTDVAGHSATLPGGVDVAIPAMNIAPDSLYIIPQQRHAVVGQPVTVTVVCGLPAHPFQFMTGSGLLTPLDATYVADSFNVGAPGGLIDTPDGIWADMLPSGGFLLAPDAWYIPQAFGETALHWEFNLTPLYGHELTTSHGALFNCQFKFTTPGVKTLSFLRSTHNGYIRQTYYDDMGNSYDWGALYGATLEVDPDPAVPAAVVPGTPSIPGAPGVPGATPVQPAGPTAKTPQL